jgi:hypothetical protein
MSSACVSRIRRNGLLRSVTAPASGATHSAENRSLSAMAPTHAGEWVSSHASQPTPVFCIQVPTDEKPWPVLNTT